MPPGDVRVEERQDPRIVDPTDAIIGLSASCVCGSDLWPYRGVEAVEGPAVMGHEYVGVVQEVGRQVRAIRPGQFVVGSFWAASDVLGTGWFGAVAANVQPPKTAVVVVGDGAVGLLAVLAARQLGPSRSSP